MGHSWGCVGGGSRAPSDPAGKGQLAPSADPEGS